VGQVISGGLVKLISYAAVTLELRKKVKQSIIGLLSVRLDVADVSQATKAALSNVHKDITETSPAMPDRLYNVVSKLSIFVDIVDEASKVCTGTSSLIATIHDLVVTGPSICQFRLADHLISLHRQSRIFFIPNKTHDHIQAVKAQVSRDKVLLGLVATMEEVCSFVDVIKSVPNRLRQLEDIINDILKQIVECSIFIREYTGHGFAGMPFISPTHSIPLNTFSSQSCRTNFFERGPSH
jgi:hypothetical protein